MSSGLRARDGALVNHWYIACLSSELKQQPIQRVIYERPYVLFRNQDGKPGCLPDRCLHRAAQLSKGTCENGRLVCPYHGWNYDVLGNVVAIPSEGPCEVPSGARVRPNLFLESRPIYEQDGCIWIWLGEGTPQPLTPPWRFPHAANSQWATYMMITDFPNEVTHLIENFMDVPHTVFVHRGWFRRRSMKRVPIDIEIKQASVLVTYHQPKDSIGFLGRILNPKNQPMVHTDRFVFPNLTRVDYSFGPGYEFIINSQCTPVESGHTRVYTYIAFRLGRMTSIAKPFMRWYTGQVIEQDVDIMRNQGESFARDPSENFSFTEADEMHIAIHRLRRMGVDGDASLWNYIRKSEREFWI